MQETLFILREHFGRENKREKGWLGHLTLIFQNATHQSKYSSQLLVIPVIYIEITDTERTVVPIQENVFLLKYI